MLQSDQSIKLHDVEQAIGSGIRFLRFDPRIEKQLNEDIGGERCKRMIRLNIIALFIYHCFLYSDYRSVGDVFRLDCIMHFAIITPMALGVNWVLSRNPPARLREGLESGAIVILALSILIVVSRSRHPDRDLVNFAQALVVLFAIFMQRIRFWYVLAVCAVVQAFFSVASTLMEPYSADRTILSNFIFLCVVVYSLVGGYNLEHELRMGYLLRMRDLFRTRQFEIASLRDALTGIGNRRALELALKHSSGQTGRNSSPSTAILLLDIDHFKLFNDTNGHQKGDDCLKKVAALIAGSLPASTDSVYRFGGEEFLVLLDDTTLHQAVLVAERIRLAVERAQIARDQLAKVTVSVGVAVGARSANDPAEALIAAADRALYNAKSMGRNRVSSAADSGPQVPRDSSLQHLAS